jgi:hypothetical protein
MLTTQRITENANAAKQRLKNAKGVGLDGSNPTPAPNVKKRKAP